MGQAEQQSERLEGSGSGRIPSSEWVGATCDIMIRPEILGSPSHTQQYGAWDIIRSSVLMACFCLAHDAVHCNPLSGWSACTEL